MALQCAFTIADIELAFLWGVIRNLLVLAPESTVNLAAVRCPILGVAVIIIGCQNLIENGRIGSQVRQQQEIRKQLVGYPVATKAPDATGIGDNCTTRLLARSTDALQSGDGTVAVLRALIVASVPCTFLSGTAV
jgi:hypothetical protein